MADSHTTGSGVAGLADYPVLRPVPDNLAERLSPCRTAVLRARCRGSAVTEHDEAEFYMAIMELALVSACGPASG